MQSQSINIFNKFHFKHENGMKLLNLCYVFYVHKLFKKYFNHDLKSTGLLHQRLQLEM